MLSVDPLYAGAVGDAQRWNRYAYALGSPLNYVDPDGRTPLQCAPPSVGTLYNCSRDYSGGPASGNGFPGYTQPSQFSYGGGNADYEALTFPGGFGYRLEPTPCGGLTACSSTTQDPEQGFVVQPMVVEIAEDGTLTFVPDPDPDTSIPIGPPVATIGSVGRSIGRVLARIFGTRAAPVVPRALQLKAAGQVHDRGGLTAAGRALAKHGGRKGSVYPSPTGNPSAINMQGQRVLNDIIDTSQLVKRNSYGGLDYIAMDGRGARYDGAGRFIGFLEP
jgi:hypothetical protein